MNTLDVDWGAVRPSWDALEAEARRAILAGWVAPGEYELQLWDGKGCRRRDTLRAPCFESLVLAVYACTAEHGLFAYVEFVGPLPEGPAHVRWPDDESELRAFYTALSDLYVAMRTNVLDEGSDTTLWDLVSRVEPLAARRVDLLSAPVLGTVLDGAEG